MADTAQSTPHSGSETNTPKFSAPKDKNCPFCKQAFTSSSLGRHLDLFIREKNPKPPDGIHVVEEIRKIRGRITRRQPRNSLNKDSPSSSAIRGGSVRGNSRVLSPEKTEYVPMSSLEGSRAKTKINEMAWHATGVINDLPPRRSSGTERMRDVSRHLQHKLNLERRRKTVDQEDLTKAHELALREVLESITEASIRSSKLGLSEFEKLNFPSLSITMLPLPRTLSSYTPYANKDSCSILPPGEEQYEALKRQVKKRLSAYNATRQAQQVRASSLGLVDMDQNLLSHLEDAYSHWKSLPEKEKQEKWQVEILRAFSGASEKLRETQKELEIARRELENLKYNMGMSSENVDMSPTIGSSRDFVRLPVSAEEVFEKGSAALLHNLNYEQLIERSLNIVRENQSPSRGMEPLPQAPVTSPPEPEPAEHSESPANHTEPKPNAIDASSLQDKSSDTPMEDEGDDKDGEGEDEDAEAEDVDAEAEDVDAEAEDVSEDASIPPAQPSAANQQSSQSHLKHQKYSQLPNLEQQRAKSPAQGTHAAQVEAWANQNRIANAPGAGRYPHMNGASGGQHQADGLNVGSAPMQIDALEGLGDSFGATRYVGLGNTFGTR